MMRWWKRMWRHGETLWHVLRGQVYRAETVEWLPPLTQLHQARVYLVGEVGAPWQAAFLCPCGCRSLIQLNLLPDAKPRWQYRLARWGEVTLAPSVWRNMGCRSHFVMRKGRIRWCL
ncbi:DUF6527 family protein [Hymenobacter wooponensis]|uniref:DUF6527 family protein n=1 Tax=Hymenobacter wooponensis TaxID=1525360 RepID=UPI003CC9AC59